LSTRDIRHQLIDFLKRELIGPDPVQPYIQGNGEEILVKEPPRMRYGAGILYPQEILADDIDNTSQTEEEIYTSLEDEGEEQVGMNIEIEREGNKRSSDENNDANDDSVNLANNYMPSALGFSAFVEIPQSGFRIYVKAGRYNSGTLSEELSKGREKPPKAYFRESLDTEIIVEARDIPTVSERIKMFHIKKDDNSTGLLLNITNRSTEDMESNNRKLITFTLINNKECSDKHRINNEDCFFQVELAVQAADSSDCFLPYPEKKLNAEMDDLKANQLLYRNHRSYAVGHGCAASWKETERRATEICTEIIPNYEVKPILPAQFEDVSLKMYEMSDYGNLDNTIRNLAEMCNKYEAWIVKQQDIIDSAIQDDYRDVAETHIEKCMECLGRMRDGIKLIQTDNKVRRAFNLMNRAMLMQQLRYGLKLREWKLDENKKTVIDPPQFPDIHNKSTWPIGLGSWRPFQVAFVLMNLKCMANPEDSEREIVDLIWFPTGGGKTEAYLGLTAFTVFLRKLRNPMDSGTTVLMRYTLRLLTAQQYQRAASLICACEVIRKESQGELGNERITIGLWVGESLTPNKMSDAVSSFNDLEQGRSKENPFIMLKCPWCGAQMGPASAIKSAPIKGYKKKGRPSRIVFECHDSNCDFSTGEFNLPLQVIDEEIYNNPPTLIIGTVDKFAMLPWKPEAKSLFGYRNGGRVTPPELIIQDELHLISGPLGSMVGHYETLINELCLNKADDRKIKPKIVASTATISRAKEQGNALYNCGKDNVFQFPPQCIDAGESFFAYEDKNAKGRLYIGVHASGLPSHATTQVRVISALLQAIKSENVTNENERNHYWTILNYFNSIRELGHAATLTRADIPEYLNAMWNRKGIKKTVEGDSRRFINRAMELTSRISNNEIPEALQSLEVDYPAGEGRHPVDICLATNMISVGVDVPRLGIMTVIGQPKTTSEYIQATSRVGRSKDGPGMVVVIYNTSKPRDRSHYEHFNTYHSKIYSYVEPTSVTPFAAPVRERALHALLVGFIRFMGNPTNEISPQPMPDEQLIEEIKEIIASRIDNIDPDEVENTLKLFDERIDEWKRYYPAKYGSFSAPQSELQLMYPSGTSPHSEWEGKSWATPTSMRNVDANCEAKVVGRYPDFSEEE
jgi:hypothetical protein